MTSFEDRERAFEAKYAHDEEFRFRVTARRDKLFAQWVAEQLHLSDAGKAEITQAILAVQDGAQHDERVLETMHQIVLERGGTTKLPGLGLALQQCGERARQLLLESRQSV